MTKDQRPRELNKKAIKFNKKKNSENEPSSTIKPTEKSHQKKRAHAIPNIPSKYIYTRKYKALERRKG